MKAVTLWRPWSHAVAWWGKDVENRTWPAPRSVLGERIAIHAGHFFDADGADWMQAHADVLGIDPDAAELAWAHATPAGVIVATAVVRRTTTHSPSPWACGPWVWVLEDVVALRRPVLCRGAQGVWTVPAPVVASVGRT